MKKRRLSFVVILCTFLGLSLGPFLSSFCNKNFNLAYADQSGTFVTDFSSDPSDWSRPTTGLSGEPKTNICSYVSGEDSFLAFYGTSTNVGSYVSNNSFKGVSMSFSMRTGDLSSTVPNTWLSLTIKQSAQLKHGETGDYTAAASDVQTILMQGSYFYVYRQGVQISKCGPFSSTPFTVNGVSKTHYILFEYAGSKQYRIYCSQSPITSATEYKTIDVPLVGDGYVGLITTGAYANFSIDNLMVWNSSGGISASSSQFNVTLQGNTTYTGKQVTPDVSKVMYNNVALLKGIQYAYTYGENINAGNGTVKISMKSGGGFSGELTKTFSITRASGSFGTEPTPITNLSFNGKNQALINPGSSNTGTYYYSLNGTDYSTDVSTGFFAGDYTISYYVEGDGNHNNTGVRTLSAHIGTTFYQINYETNGGQISGDYPTTYEGGVGVTLPTTVNYNIYNGFAGWYTNNGLMDGQWGDKVTSITSTDYGDKTFYARYKEYGASEANKYLETDKISSGETIYLDVSNYFDSGRGWASDDATFALYMCDLNDNWTWSEKLTVTVETNVYAFTFPFPDGNTNKWKTIIAVRFGPNSQPSWDTKWNQTDNISFNGANTYDLNLDPTACKNTIKIDGWDKNSSSTLTTKLTSGLVSGDAIYLDLQQYSSEHYWYSEDTKYVIYFFDDFGRKSYSKFMTRVNGVSGYTVSDDESYPLFETTVPTGSNGESVIWPYCIAIRVSKDCTDSTEAFNYQYNHHPGEWDMVNGKTDNLTWNSTTCFEKNVIKIYYGKTDYGNVPADLDYERSYEYRADAYENYLYRWFCETCDATYGHTNLDDMKSNWNTEGTRANGSNFEDQYNNMNELAQGFFWLQEALPEGTTAEKAAFLYDYCVNKYGTNNLPDFAKRNSNATAYGQNSYRLSFGENESQTTLIVIIAASATLLATSSTLLLILKKRKKATK